MKIAIVIPAYNEENYIAQIIQAIPAHTYKNEISVYVVNDGSTDQTGKIVRALIKDNNLLNTNNHKYTHPIPPIHLINHRINLGKGAAAKTGCDLAFKQGADFIVLMDSDGQHRLSELPHLLKPVLKNQADLVIGSRGINNKMPTTMRVGNFFLSVISRLLFNIQTRDTQSGYRAFSAKIYPKLRWVDPQYAMETEMLILAALNRLRVHEVSIPTVYHDNYKGTTVVDGLRILKTLLKWRFSLAKTQKAASSHLTNPQ